jgi:hypothetical protein
MPKPNEGDVAKMKALRCTPNTVSMSSRTRVSREPRIQTSESRVKFSTALPQPEAKASENIWSVARGKVADEQTRRVSLNLDDSDVSIDQLKEQFGRWHIQDLEEVIAVRDRKIYRIFP